MSMYSRIEEYIQMALVDNNYACCHWAGNGPIAELETKLCTMYGAKHGLCVDSATNGLLYLILASGLKRSEIITTPLSYAGTIAGALNMGCTFSFADIDRSLNIDPESVLMLLKKRNKTKAVISVDYGGNPHQMEEIHTICEEYGLFHFVDAAQSMGANYNLTNVATYNDALVVSFGSGKTVFSGGEGGAIITDNTMLYNRLVSICQHPHRQERDLGIGQSHGFALNGRMHPIAALLACENLDSGILATQKKKRLYLQALSVLSSFNSVSSTLKQDNSTFYHCPFIVENPQLFDMEFSTSELKTNFYYSKAMFSSLSQQLERIGMKKRIKTSYCPFLEMIIDKLFLLHIKPSNNEQI